MSSSPLKLDTQQRTTLQGFAYSNSDPANRHDRTPTELSYIDSVFASQLQALTERMTASTGEDRRRANDTRDELLTAIEQRKLRIQGIRSVYTLDRSSIQRDEPPAGGEALVYLTMLVLFMSFAVVLTSLPGVESAMAASTIISLGMMGLLVTFVLQNFDLDPYGGFEDDEDEEDEE